PLCVGEPPNPRQRDPPLHRFDLGPTGDYSPLRLAVQNRSQLQTSHSHRWRLCVSLLDARHDSHPPRQRQTVCATQVGDLPRPHPPQARRLRAAYPVGSDCPGIAPLPRGQLPVRHLVQFPLLYPHRLLEKTPFGMGRLPRAPSHLATISPRFIPKRNPQEIPGLQNQPQTLRLFRYLSTGESGMNLPLSSKEHYGIEQTVLAGGYGYRQVLELVQNGADAILEAHASGATPCVANRVEVLLG